MQRRQTRKLSSVSNVAAGYPTLIDMPLGKTYHALNITYSGVTLAQMEGIRVFANGKLLQRYLSGTVLDKMNQFSGHAASSGVLSLDFDRFNMSNIPARELTGIGTNMPGDDMPIYELRTEIDIASAASAPAIAVSAERSAPSKSGLLKKVENRSYYVSATGEFTISDLSLGNLMSRIAFLSTSISKIRIERNGLNIFERTSAENTKILTDGKYRTVQTGYWIIDTTELGEGGNEISTMGLNEFVITLTMTGTGAVPVIIEWLATLGSI